MSKNPAVCVLTARGLDRMLEEGGSQAWVLDAKRANRRDYVICVQNCGFPDDWGNTTAPHHEAFVVAKIKKVVPSPEAAERNLILFSEYAEVSVPDAWNGQRNPVRYVTLEDMGIEVDKLKFKPMPALAVEVEEGLHAAKNGLSIEEAKKGLAQRFGVKLEQIQITINA